MSSRLRHSSLSIHPHTMTHAFLPPPTHTLPEEHAATILMYEKDAAWPGHHLLPNGSAGGLDGLCLQHLKVFNSTSAEREGRKLLLAVTWWINIVLEGIPSTGLPILFEATFREEGASGLTAESGLFCQGLILASKCFCSLNKIWKTAVAVTIFIA